MEKSRKEKRKDFFTKLKHRYRLVVMNDNTFEEKFSLRLSPLSLFVLVGVISLIMITLVISVVAFTPLRAYIPGYAADYKLEHRVKQLSRLTDSLFLQVEANDIYMQNMKQVLNGNLDTMAGKEQKRDTSQRFKNVSLKSSKEDSVFRTQLEKEEQYSLGLNSRSSKNELGSIFFFTPLKGIITAPFNSSDEHYGIDVVSKENEPIKATLDGTVLYTGWSVETGYVIQIQHTNNMVSIYKHNSSLLKKAGQNVKAGEAIAIIGNTGEQSSGPHLHFELWHNGSAVDPQHYVVF